LEVIKRLKEVVGEENVISEASVLRAYSEDYSLCEPSMPDCAVRPKETAQVQAIVRLANEKDIPVIPSSSGAHFYGTTIPSKGGIIVDLRRMDKVLEIDDRNRKMRIEPGVTWGKLQEELGKHNFTAFNPLLPHPEKSALTSLLEREPSLVPKFEYADPILTMEVVLPTGDILRTGSASVPGVPDDALVDMVCPYGPGMDFFRLFQGAQGTLGIVTWMTAKIEHFSKVRKVYFIKDRELKKLEEAAYRAQQLMIGDECFILNSLNLSLILSKKWPEEFTQLKKSLPEFVLVICLAGSLRRAEEKLAYQEEALRNLVSEFRLEASEVLPGYGDGNEMVFSVLKMPWRGEGSYWKNRLKGFCEEVSFLTTFDNISKTKDIIFKLAKKKDYKEKEIGIYLQPVEYGRACYCQFSFYYKAKDSKDAAEVKSLTLKIREALLDEGVHFSIPYGGGAEEVFSRAKPYRNSLIKIKNIFDPKGIMNPGRLCF